MNEAVREAIFRSNVMISNMNASISELNLSIVRQQDIQNMLVMASVGMDDREEIDRQIAICQSVIGDMQTQVERTQQAIKKQQATIAMFERMLKPEKGEEADDTGDNLPQGEL